MRKPVNTGKYSYVATIERLLCLIDAGGSFWDVMEKIPNPTHRVGIQENMREMCRTSLMTHEARYGEAGLIDLLRRTLTKTMREKPLTIKARGQQLQVTTRKGKNGAN